MSHSPRFAPYLFSISKWRRSFHFNAASTQRYKVPTVRDRLASLMRPVRHRTAFPTNTCQALGRRVEKELKFNREDVHGPKDEKVKRAAPSAVTTTRALINGASGRVRSSLHQRRTGRHMPEGRLMKITRRGRVVFPLRTIAGSVP